MSSQAKAYIFAAATILFWSTVATAFKLALVDQRPLQVLLVATLTATLIFLTSLAMQGKLKIIKQQTLKQWSYSMLMGLINPFLYYLLLFRAYSQLPAQVAQPLNMIWPIVLVLISVPLLGQKIGLKSIIALFISFSGVVLVSSQGAGEAFDPSQVPFMLLAVSTTIFWSFFWILNVRDKRDESLKLFMSFLFSLVYLGAASIITGVFPEADIRKQLFNIYIGFFEMGLAFLFWLRALSLSSTTDKVSNLIFIIPFISLIFIHFLLGEEIFMTTVYGLLLVILGILIQRSGKTIGKNARQTTKDNTGD